MANIPIISFNNGEVSPHIDVRSDLDKYLSSCRVLENMLPTIYGSATRRPGTKYVATAKTSTETVRLIPFIYSSTIAYVVELGHLYARFYYDGQPLVAYGSPVEIVTPYIGDDLYAIQFKQLGDTMWLVHPSYAPRKLTRTSAFTFSLDTIAFTNGPFLTRNDIENNDGVVMTSSKTVVGETGTLTCSSPYFTTGHVGAIFKLIHARSSTVVTKTSTGDSTSTSIEVKGSFTFQTHGTWTGNMYLERSEDNTNWDTYRTYAGASDRNISLAATENEDGIFYRIRTNISSGSVTADISVDTATREGIVRVDSYSTQTVANITVLKTVENVNSTKRWAEGAWSGERGYPATVAFFEDRILYAGTNHNPQTVWFSATDDYEDFEEGVLDADSFSLVLTTANRIRWVSALDYLVVGTSGSEWKIGSSRLDEPLTPTNFAAREQSVYGSANIQALRANASILFVDYVGRKLRELAYNYEQQKYVAPDMTMLAEHVTESGIVSMSMQQSPDSIVWCTLADGSLVSMTYERDQNIVAWARHPMIGAIVQSVAVIPGDTEDQVWLSVQRTIGGVAVTYIEVMSSRAWTDAADAYFVDCGVAYSGAATTTITGLTHLEGQTVSILADGAVEANAVVSGGSITLSNAATVAAVGLPMAYTLSPMRLELNMPTGSSHGSIKKINELVLSFKDTEGAQYGASLTDLYDIPWRTTENYNEAPALFTGDKIVAIDSGFTVDTPIYIYGIEPLPCTVRAIIPRVFVTET